MKNLQKDFLKLFKSLWPFFVIVLIVCLFFWKVFLKGQVPIPGDFIVGVYYPWLDYKWGFATGVPVKNPILTDVVSFTYPMQMLAIDLIKSGQYPLWNPYIFAGMPLLANFQSAPFSPTNFVYFFLNKIDAWSIQIILQHLLAAFFTFFLLRFWKVSKFGSVVGGVIYAFSGFNMIWSQWNGHTLAASFIPLIILFVDKWLRDSLFIDGLVISFSLFFLFLSGYPQVALYLAIALFMLWVVRFKKSKDYLGKTVLLAVFFILGLGLSSFQILPGAELLSLSQREIEPHPYDWAFFPWSKIITFLAPDYFGNHATQNYWGPQDYTSNTGFVGVISIIFSSAGIFLLKKKKEIKYLLSLVMVSLVFAFPTFVSVFLWKSGIFGLNAASAHRSLILFNLSIALLAAYGFDYLLKEKNVKIIKIILVPLLILFSFGSYSLAMYLLSVYKPEVYSPLVKNILAYKVSLRNLIFPTGLFSITTLLIFFKEKIKKKIKISALYIIFPFLVFELFRFGWKFTPFSKKEIVFPNTPVIDFLQSLEKPTRITGSSVIPINMRMPYKLESLEGYDAVYPLLSSKYIAALNSGRSGTDPVGRYGTVDNLDSILLDISNTKYFLSAKKDLNNNFDYLGLSLNQQSSSRFKKVFEDKSVSVFENLNSLPRAFMFYDYEKIEKEEEIINRLLDPSFPITKKIILEEDILLESNNKKQESSVYYSSYKETESVIEVETTKEGILFISDTFYPGWKVFVNNNEEKIFKANFAFRSVKVPEGKHTITFKYKPESFFLGVKISAISFVFLVFIGIGFFVVQKRSKSIYT